MFEKFSDRARKAQQQARSEARNLNHDYVGTEHLLLALTKSDGVAGSVLRNLDADYCTVKKEVSKIVQPGPEMGFKEDLPSYTLRTKNIFKLADDESRRFGHNYVGTEHLLLALMREPEGVAFTILKNLDLDFSMILKEINDILGPSQEELLEPKKEQIKNKETINKLRPLIIQQSNLIQQMLTILSQE